ncbi:hypothetical protein [Frigoriglobus tundricola]|uniref:Uncharacterized protein n=1 Tax=Frigoriglobus tundricola TaxID=2774151 RepID=A0A6M5Z152_9BACT|nr:hypothetical protein [Frigoriglobus tundricola]QJW99898.1 hypothetical protein FTUN_7521 [Frigoriglobus tundricola]
MRFTDRHALDGGHTVPPSAEAGQGFPDVIATPAASAPEVIEDLSFEDLAGPPPRRLPHEDEREWLVRALFDLGQDPIDLDFMSDAELREFYHALSPGPDR